jgi:NADH-quinone oxidoreductase subunit J
MTVVYVGLCAVILISAIVAIAIRHLLWTAVALGLGSAGLATIFFMLDAPYAGAFELSVGAGLISVLFIIAISLTESIRRNRDEP